MERPTVDVTYGEQCSQAVRLNCLIMDIAVMIQYCLYVGSTSLFILDYRQHH